MCPNKMMTWIKTHHVGEMLQKNAEAVGRADWSLRMMIMSSTNCTLGIENQGLFWLLDILSWVLKKKLGSQKADGACKRQIGCKKADIGVSKRQRVAKKAGGHHKADGAP
jgi:hypothetical protein